MNNDIDIKVSAGFHAYEQNDNPYGHHAGYMTHTYPCSGEEHSCQTVRSLGVLQICVVIQD
jgi:hypothetical protein